LITALASTLRGKGITKGRWMMTGKDLIIYILQHNLEDEVIFENGGFKGFMTEKELASKFGVGRETVKLWYEFGWIEGIQIGESIFFTLDTPDPRP